MADYTFLDLWHGFADKEHGDGWHELFGVDLGQPVLNAGGHITLSHVVFGLAAAAVGLLLALIARGKYSDRDSALVPEGRLSIRNFFELIFDAIWNMMTDMMGEKNAKLYFPLIASLGIFILLGNLMGLVPGFLPPTQNLNTTLAASIVVFVVYNIAGLKEHGLGHLKHFLGPVLWLAPLMLIIELIGHAFRPVSLGVRLTGNMTGDHMVLGAFGGLADTLFSVPLLFPIPFYFLGLLVCCIQTLVFCLLSSIYIALSVQHEEH